MVPRAPAAPRAAQKPASASSHAARSERPKRDARTICTCHDVPDAPSHKRELDALARIEGQVRGIQRMVVEGRYCMDILTQTRAIHAALRRVERHILQAHLQTCVRDSFHHGSEEDREQKIIEILSFFDWEPGRPTR